jgi:hypothetical protein
MAAFKECDSDEERFWVKYCVVDWRYVQQDRKGRNLADHAAMLEAFPDPAARESFLAYKKSGKIRAINTIAGQARKWREIQISCFRMTSTIARITKIDRNNRDVLPSTYFYSRAVRPYLDPRFFEPACGALYVRFRLRTEDQPGTVRIRITWNSIKLVRRQLLELRSICDGLAPSGASGSA